jgi:hypothetical protein
MVFHTISVYGKTVIEWWEGMLLRGECDGGGEVVQSLRHHKTNQKTMCKRLVGNEQKEI